jgi:hypothetical protein
MMKFDQPSRVESWYCPVCFRVVARLAQRPERFRGKEEGVDSNSTVGLWIQAQQFISRGVPGGKLIPVPSRKSLTSKASGVISSITSYWTTDQ